MRRFATDRPPHIPGRSLRLAVGCCVLGLLLPALGLLLPGPQVAFAAPSNVSGLVYRDYNDDGVRDAREPPVPGVLVRGYIAPDPNAAEVVGAEARTAADGTYTLSIPADDGTAVRVEFDVPSNGFQSSAYGANSGTTVQFVRTPASNVNLGILRPGQYCQASAALDLVTSCYSFGNQLGPDPNRPSDPPVLVDFPYEAGKSPRFPTPDDPSTHALAVPAASIGSTWGLAYQRSSNSVFAGAFLKRHSGFGPNGPGAIYRLNPSVANGAASLWLDLNALFPGAAGTDPRAGNNDYFVDAASWDQVGKAGLGDVEMFEDDRTLYVIALGDRRLYRLPVGADGAAPAAGAISRYDLPDPAACTRDPATPAGELNYNMRPFALAVNDGLVYVGMVCTAQSTQSNAELQAYVYAFDPAGGAFAAQPALNFGLSFPRGCLAIFGGCATRTPGDWTPWLQSYSQVKSFDQSGFRNVSAPQPWLTGIDFDNGAMLLSFRDRNGDQIGSASPAPDGSSPPWLVGLAGGDILRACPSGSGTWAIEGSAGCIPPQTGFTPPSQAPLAGREFFYQDNHTYHDETAGGGILHVPGYPEVAQVSNDPVVGVEDTHDGGVRWYSADTGTTSWVYRLFDGDLTEIPPAVFGKSNGLGDLEALCDEAPVEIGNRVWYDTNQDGIQSPGEAPVVGVTLHLYDANGTLLATAVTNAQGEYYFRGGPASGDANPADHIGLLEGPVGLNTSYQIRIDNPADVAPGGPLDGWYLTYEGRGPSPVRDSNGQWSSTQPGTAEGYTFADALTGLPGQNDHTFDFGFIQNPTRIRLQSFTAALLDGGVEVRWSTGAEIETWGFRLLRSSSGSRADAVVVTPQLIVAQGRGGGGASYVWLDTSAQAGVAYRYWLQEIELNGTAIEYGPATVTQPAATRRYLYLPHVWR